MNEQELRSLDLWIAINVAGWKLSPDRDRFGNQYYERNGAYVRAGDFPKDVKTLPSYTTDRAAAMEVLERCLSKKLIGDTIISKDGDYWLRVAVGHGDVVDASAPTLPLAICLFAKKLFEKEAK